MAFFVKSSDQKQIIKWQRHVDSVRPGDVSTVEAARDVLQGQSKRGILARILPFLGPAFIACVAYIDPGNFATNIQAGSEFGYMLVWVIIASNLMAMLIQTLSAKLGIATGMNLAEMCREQFPRPLVWGMWGLSEIIAMATDLAEFLGAAIGFNLLFHIPLLAAGILTGITTFIILGLEGRGFRPLEAVIMALVGVVAGSYLIETFLDRPNWGQIAYHAVVPQFGGTEGILLAVGILGATVMPHVIFLHSSLTRHRIKTPDEQQKRRLFRFELLDVIIAMTLAWLGSLSMLVMASAPSFQPGLITIATINAAYGSLHSLLSNPTDNIFASL